MNQSNLLIKFEHNLKYLLNHFDAASGRLGGGKMPSLGLALSGGSDSMALAQLCRDAGIRVERCLHVDHRLRRESQEEAQKVQRWAGDLLDLPCDISSMPWQPEACPFPASRAQREGRLLRRRALRDWAVSHGLPLVLMAHHADDQAETFFMRVAQQTGLQGLQCIRPLAPLHLSLIHI